MLWPIFKKTGALNASSFDHDLYFPLVYEITAIVEARSKVPYTNAVNDKVVSSLLRNSNKHKRLAQLWHAIDHESCREMSQKHTSKIK